MRKINATESTKNAKVIFFNRKYLKKTIYRRKKTLSLCVTRIIVFYLQILMENGSFPNLILKRFSQSDRQNTPSRALKMIIDEQFLIHLAITLKTFSRYAQHEFWYTVPSINQLRHYNKNDAADFFFTVFESAFTNRLCLPTKQNTALSLMNSYRLFRWHQDVETAGQGLRESGLYEASSHRQWFHRCPICITATEGPLESGDTGRHPPCYRDGTAHSGQSGGQWSYRR